VSRKLSIAISFLVCTAITVAVYDQFTKKQDHRLGQPAVDVGKIMGMDVIKFKKDQSEIVLVTDQDGVWRLGSKTGFPADAAKIRRFIDDLTRIKVQVLASTSSDVPPEFGMGQAIVAVIGKHDDDLAHLKLGAYRDRGGQFISFDSDTKVYLISERLDISADEAFWELKRLLNINAEMVKRLEFNPPASTKKRSVTLTRQKSDEPIKIEGLAGKAKEAPGLRSHEGLLSAVDFMRRLPSGDSEAKRALANPWIVTVNLFDGRIFEIQVGRIESAGTSKCFIHIKGKAEGSITEAERKHVEWINSQMASQSFEVSSLVAERFLKGMDDMVEKTSMTSKKM
jgi:hypothetical protein